LLADRQPAPVGTAIGTHQVQHGDVETLRDAASRIARFHDVHNAEQGGELAIYTSDFGINGIDRPGFVFLNLGQRGLKGLHIGISVAGPQAFGDVPHILQSVEQAFVFGVGRRLDLAELALYIFSKCLVVDVLLSGVIDPCRDGTELSADLCERILGRFREI